MSAHTSWISDFCRGFFAEMKGPRGEVRLGFAYDEMIVTCALDQSDLHVETEQAVQHILQCHLQPSEYGQQMAYDLKRRMKIRKDIKDFDPKRHLIADFEEPFALPPENTE